MGKENSLPRKAECFYFTLSRMQGKTEKNLAFCVIYVTLREDFNERKPDVYPPASAFYPASDD